MKNSFRKRLLITLSVSLGGIFIIVILIVLLGLDIKEKSEYIAETNRDLSRIASISSQLSEFRALEDEVELAVNKLDQYVPSKDVILFVPSELQQVARRNNLSYVFNFVGNDQVVSGGIMSASFEISVQGDYNDIMRFINDLENTRYFINILNLDVNVQSGGNYNGIIRAIIYFHA